LHDERAAERTPEQQRLHNERAAEKREKKHKK
jgi:hypothetical protein